MTNKFIKKTFLIIVFLVGAGCIVSQNNPMNTGLFNKPIIKDSSLSHIISEILLSKINDYHAKHGLDSLFVNIVLNKAAENQANYLAVRNEATWIKKVSTQQLPTG